MLAAPSLGQALLHPDPTPISGLSPSWAHPGLPPLNPLHSDVVEQNGKGVSPLPFMPLVSSGPAPNPQGTRGSSLWLSPDVCHAGDLQLPCALVAPLDGIQLCCHQ